MLLLGVICESFYGAERIATMKPQETISIRGYDLSFDGLVSRQGPNYRELIAKFTVRRDGATIDTLEPSKRSFTTRGNSTTEAALLTRGFSQLYVSLGDPEPDGSISVRIYHKPLVLLIWFGALVMAFGGLLSLSDRRLRVGAPKPAQEIGSATRGMNAPMKRVTTWIRVFIFAVSLLGACPAHAVQPDEILPDPALETRARNLSRELRCMVCQNQSIDDSDAPLARDLRLLVRERLKAGDSDTQIVRFSGRALRRFRSAQAAFHSRTRRCCGCCRSWCLIAGAAALLVLRRRQQNRSGSVRLSDEEEARRCRSAETGSGCEA